jgi:hypothetical protein
LKWIFFQKQEVLIEARLAEKLKSEFFYNKKIISWCQCYSRQGVGESELDTHKMHKLIYSCIHIHFAYHVQKQIMHKPQPNSATSQESSV